MKTLALGLSLALLVSAGLFVSVEAYTNDELSNAIAGAYNIAKNARVGTFAMETCTNQLTIGDMSNVDSCINVTKIFNKYMSLAVSEANGDIQKITGYGTGLN